MTTTNTPRNRREADALPRLLALLADGVADTDHRAALEFIGAAVLQRVGGAA